MTRAEVEKMIRRLKWLLFLLALVAFALGVFVGTAH